MIATVRIAPKHRWCYRLAHPAPKTLMIDTASMRQTIKSEVDDRTTPVPTRTRCGGRFWKVIGQDDDDWICEHMLEMD
jgi:hypothetical protein